MWVYDVVYKCRFEFKTTSKRHRMNQNDIKTTYGSDQNDISLNNPTNIGLFQNSVEKSLAAYAQKIGKVVSAIYLVTDVMDGQLPLTASLRSQSIELLNACYGLLSVAQPIGSDALVRIAVRIEQVATLVTIGSIAHHISPMNADIIGTELKNIRELIGVDIATVTASEKKFAIHPGISIQPNVPKQILDDESFAALLSRHESKRHQQSIKTTLTTKLNQNDNQNDIRKIKTTFQNDIPEIARKDMIISVIRSIDGCTLADIKPKMKSISDKTLQREIAELMTMGLIKREGNKRWAIYRAI